jgi:hypothetical protein
VIFVFLIFNPPEFVDFPDEPFQLSRVRRVLDGFNLAHEMPVVKAVAVVVSQNPAIDLPGNSASG